MQILENDDNYYNGTIINKVLGRTSDIIHLENGNVITGTGFTVLFKDFPVEHYYIEKDGYNTIKCTIVRMPEYNIKHEETIYSTFRKHIGQDGNVEICYAENIPLTSGGKRLYFKDNNQNS